MGIQLACCGVALCIGALLLLGVALVAVALLIVRQFNVVQDAIDKAGEPYATCGKHPY